MASPSDASATPAEPGAWPPRARRRARRCRSRAHSQPRRTAAVIARTAALSVAALGTLLLPPSALAQESAAPAAAQPPVQMPAQTPGQKPLPPMTLPLVRDPLLASRGVENLPTPLTLAQAIEAALRLQPDIAAATANREVSEHRLRQAESAYYPRVTPSYNYQNFYSFGTINRNLGGGVIVPITGGQTTTNRQGELNYNYTLFNSFQRELNARQSRQSLRASRYGEVNTRQAVISVVADNYFFALQSDALLRVSEAQVARAKNTLDVITAQVDVGVAARKDILQAQADYLNAQVSLLGARNDAEVAQAQLKAAIGSTGGERLTLASVPIPTQDTPLAARQPDGSPFPLPSATAVAAERINDIAELAFRNRPDVAQSKQNLEVSETGVRIARANAGLQIDASFSGGFQFVPDDSNSRQLSLALSYPLFDGGNVRSQVRSSQAQVKASEANLLGLQQQIAVEAEQAYRNLAQARASLPAAEAAQYAAQINYEAALEARKEGLGSIVDVITAQTSLVQAQINYIQAIFEFYAADARLARAVGQAERIGTNIPVQGSAPLELPVAPPAGVTPPATPGAAATPPPGGAPR
ncbi:MAG TPA: TolC family protein [Armatimonadaceae bacterium]|nr:TolC family protein [Armatimonadaceae bacterium]